MGLILSPLILYYQARRMDRSQFYPQRWYWFITYRMHKKGYTKWKSFRILRKFNFV